MLSIIMPSIYKCSTSVRRAYANARLPYAEHMNMLGFCLPIKRDFQFGKNIKKIIMLLLSFGQANFAGC